MKPGAIVLAGGASARFGADKLAALLDGRPVLERTVSAVSLVASPVVLVLAPDAQVPAWSTEAGRSMEPGVSREPARSIVIARDPEPFGGPLVGLAAGLAALREAAPDAECALVVGGDMPTLLPAVLELLATNIVACPGTTVVTLEADPRSVLPMAVRVEPTLDACRAILAGQGKRSLRALLAVVPSTAVPAADWRELDPAAATLHDIDTPADLG